MTGVPHVTGVTVGGTTVVHADLVVDATGRRSPVSGMLTAVGARRPDEEKEDCGFVYYAPALPVGGRLLPARQGTAAAALRGRVDPHPAVRLRDLGRGLRHLGA